MIMAMLRSLFNDRCKMPNLGEEAIRDIEIFSLYPQIGCLMSEGKKNLFFSDPIRERLKNEYERTTVQNLLIKHELEVLLASFEDQEIEVIPLKGVRFAERYFGSLSARETSDIDLLIRPVDLHKTLHCINAAGFSDNHPEDETNNHCSFYKKIPRKSVAIEVEIHWNIDKEYYSSVNTDVLFEQAYGYRDYKYVKELSDQHTFYMICLHGARHKMDSLKYFVDIIQILSVCKDSINYSELFAQSYHDRTFRRVKAVLAIVYEQFPFLHETSPLPIHITSIPWKYKTILNACRGKKTAHYYFYKFIFNYCLFDSFKYLFLSLRITHVLFPPKNYLRFVLDIRDDHSRSLLKLYCAYYLKKWRARLNRSRLKEV